MRANKRKWRANILIKSQANKIKLLKFCVNYKSLTLKIYQQHHYCTLRLGNIPLRNWWRINHKTPTNAVMKHILLSVITVGSKDIKIGILRLGDRLIRSNQSSASIDKRGCDDWLISLGSMNSCTEMRRIGFGWNKNEGISMSPPITIRSIIPQTNRTGQESFEIFESVRGKLYLSYRSNFWYGLAKR